MPISKDDLVGQNGKQPEMKISLEPVFNCINSLCLLSKDDNKPGLRDWIIETRNAMSLEERMRNALVLIGLYHTFIPDASWQSFAGFLDQLAARDPEALRDRMLNIYYRCTDDTYDMKRRDVMPASEKARVLASEESYLAFLTEHFGDAIDYDIEAQAYRYAVDPPAMRDLIVGHLRSMWNKYLEPEWARVRTMLAESVSAFRSVDLSGMSRMEALPYVTGRDLNSCTSWETLIRDAERIVFVPSVHIGPYLAKIISGSTLVVLFGARLPDGVHRDTAQDLTRTEIVTRLSAMADEGRLRILRMAADAGEVRATDVMVALDVSQSAASRHLTQLTANGYLTERRCEGGKCYSFNAARVSGALGAVSQYLRIAPAAKMEST